MNSPGTGKAALALAKRPAGRPAGRPADRHLCENRVWFVLSRVEANKARQGEMEFNRTAVSEKRKIVKEGRSHRLDWKGREGTKRGERERKRKREKISMRGFSQL